MLPIFGDYTTQATCVAATNANGQHGVWTTSSPVAGTIAGGNAAGGDVPASDLSSDPALPNQGAADGADVLAVCCPYEVSRFEDAVKSTGNEGKLVVKDIIELVVESME